MDLRIRRCGRMKRTNSTEAEDQALLACMVAADRAGAAALVEDYISRQGPDSVVERLLEPALESLGRRWATAEDLSLAQGFVAAKIAEDTLDRVAEELPAGTPVTEPRGRVVLGNIEDDYHALGRRLVATFLRADGWEVEDLGNDVLPEVFIERALEREARVIGISAMVWSTALNIRKVRRELDRRRLGNRLKLAVGGAVFLARPDLVDQVGADGTARNALGASALVSHLVAESVASETQEATS